MILVCGEALIDLFVEDSPTKGLVTEAVPGGSPFNVAIALSRLGLSAAFLGGLSTDHFGRVLAGKLSAEGVDLTHAVRSPCLTTISVVATDPAGHPSYSFHGDGKADRQVTRADLPSSLPPRIEAITFGSYTLAVPPVADAFLALAKRETGRVTISIDPNVRPTVTPDMGVWRRRFEAFLPHASIVKASDEDLALAYGRETEVGGLVRRWHEAGPGIVLVTHGEGGATGYLRGHAPVFVPGRRVEVRDTVGAGDTFHAALLASLARIGRLASRDLPGLSVAELQQVMQYAVAAASITCTRQGADVPTAAEVQSVLEASGMGKSPSPEACE